MADLRDFIAQRDQTSIGLYVTEFDMLIRERDGLREQFERAGGERDVYLESLLLLSRHYGDLLTLVMDAGSLIRFLRPDLDATRPRADALLERIDAVSAKSHPASQATAPTGAVSPAPGHQRSDHPESPADSSPAISLRKGTHGEGTTAADRAKDTLSPASKRDAILAAEPPSDEDVAYFKKLHEGDESPASSPDFDPVAGTITVRGHYSYDSEQSPATEPRDG